MILPTDLELCEAAAATYVPEAVPFCEVLGSSMALFTTTREDGLVTIAVEGSHDTINWAVDFCSLVAEPRYGLNHPNLGFVHAAFYSSAELALPKILPLAEKGPVALAGHSLGAIEALMLGAMLTVRNLPPVKIGAFAPPRGGGAQFVRIATSVPFCAYRYGEDPVPEVPLTIPPLFPYQQVPLVQLPGPTSGSLSLSARLACHHIANYVAGVKAAAILATPTV
jgi:hypothetical protein